MQQTNYRLRLPNERTSQIIVKSSKLQIRSKGKDESIGYFVGFLAAAESAPARRFPYLKYNLNILIKSLRRLLKAEHITSPPKVVSTVV